MKRQRNSLLDRVFKAQWPLATNEQPMVLLYPDSDQDDPGKWYYLPATTQVRKHLFRNKFIKVYFRGHIDNGQAVVTEFVRKDEWL